MQQPLRDACFAQILCPHDKQALPRGQKRQSKSMDMFGVANDRLFEVLTAAP